MLPESETCPAPFTTNVAVVDPPTVKAVPKFKPCVPLLNDVGGVKGLTPAPPVVAVDVVER